MWIRSELKERGKITFKRFYWKSVIVCFICLLLTGGLGSSVTNRISDSYDSNMNNIYDTYSDDEYYDSDDEYYYDGDFEQEILDFEDAAIGFFTSGFFFLFLGISIVIMIVGFIIKLLIIYPIEIGKNNFFMGIREEEKTLDSLIFIYKSGQLKNTIFTMFMKGLFQFLWSLLFVIPGIIKAIFESAFGLREMAVGSMSGMILVGIKRGLFSNEAGMGSAPNAAATADVTHPVKQGLIQTLGVFTDTIVICSCTAFMILLYSDYATAGLEGIELTQAALSSQIGPIGNVFIAICILLFAFSSIVGNYYYGESNIEFMSKNKTILNVFRAMVVGMVLFGSVAKVQLVWDLADVFMGIMAVINLVAIALLGKYAFIALKDYSDQKNAGIKEPVFDASNIAGLENVECWKEEREEKVV